MRKQVETVFPQCVESNCIEEQSGKVFYIADQEAQQPCCTVATEEEAHIVLQNPTERIINFLKIDQCLFFEDSEHKKCDCVVFDSGLFCYVEIKNTVRAKQRQKHRRKAREQLKQTIEIFQDKLDFRGFEQQAIVCFTFRPARPLASTSAQEAAILFQDNYNVSLVEGNEITF